MRRQVGWVVAAVVVGLWAGEARAQDVSQALKLVPEDAAGFALVNRIGDTVRWIDNLGKKMFPKEAAFPSFRELIHKELGIEKGLDEKGDLVMVIYLAPGAKEQTSVYGVPVTDYKEFLSGLKPGEAKEGVSEITLANGQKLLAASKGHHALLARPDHAAALKKVLAADKSIVAASKPMHDFLTGTTYSLVLTPRGLEVSSFLYVINTLNFFISGHMFPLDFLGPFWATLFKLLPFQYLAYFPAAVFLGKIQGEALVQGLLVGVAWAVALVLLARFLYRRGLRHYSAFGG